MRNIGWIIAAVLILAAAGFFIWWRSASSTPVKQQAAQRLTPKISVASLQVTDIDDEHIKVMSTVRLNNPLPVALNAKGLQYELYIDSIRVMKDAYSKPISVAASDSSVIQLPLELEAKALTSVLRYFDEHNIDSADYTVKATVLMDVPIAGNRSFNMNVTKRLPALHLPKVKVQDVDLNALQLEKKGVDLVVQVTNPNVFPLEMQDGTFSFTVEDDLKLNGAMEKIVHIPPHGTKDISLHAQVADGSVMKTGWKLLTNKDDTHFTYNFRCKLASQSGLLKNSRMSTTVKGTLGELVRAVKKAP